MRNLLTVVFCISFLISAKAQYKKEFGGSFGTSNYLGDIGGGLKEGRQNSPLDLKFKAQRLTLNAYCRYKLTKSISLRGSLIYIRLSGNDANTANPERNARNLSFKTDVIELLTTGEWNFFQQTKMASRSLGGSKKGKKRMDFRAFAFTGIGVIYFNPRAELLGKSYNLRPLKTEGAAYKPFTWVVPVGLGVAYTFNKKWRIGADMSYRITGSDWLDDVSGNYNVSYADGAKGYAAVKAGSTNEADIRNALGNRTSEVQPNYKGEVSNNGSLPIGANYDVTANGGTPRGGNFIPGASVSNLKKISEKDGYVMFNITVGYVIKGKNKYYATKYRNIVNRRKVVKKKTRAKF